MQIKLMRRLIIRFTNGAIQGTHYEITLAIPNAPMRYNAKPRKLRENEQMDVTTNIARYSFNVNTRGQEIPLHLPSQAHR